MAISIKYDKSIDCMVILGTGVIGSVELLQLVSDLVVHEKFRKNINQLVDCTNGELALTIDDLQKIADGFSGIGDLLGFDRRLALVVSRDLDFGKMRQYEAFFQAGPGVKVHVFRSLTGAHEWLMAR